jgi:hypothetical protein
VIARRGRRRIIGAVTAISASLSLALVVAAVDAGTARGDGIGGYSLSAHAVGFEAAFDFPSAQTHPLVAGSVPIAQATTDAGPLSYALGDIAWPGTLIGNAGETLVIGGGSSVPPSAGPYLHRLDDPVRAEARSPAGPVDSVYDGAPGSTMLAHADATGSHGTASIQGVSVPGDLTLGTILADGVTTVTASLGKSTANGRVGNIDLGAGVVHIDAVTSTATAQSDGVTGKGTATTIVTGLKIAGIAASIDQTGLHIGNSSAPVNTALNQAVAQALSKAGITMVVTAPIERKKGPLASETGGALVITAGQQGYVFTFTFGGAIATANASPCFDCATASDTGSAGSTASPSLGASSGPLLGSGDTTLSPGPLGSSTSAPARARSGAVALGPTRSISADFGRGTAWWLVGLAVLAAAVAALGLCLLGDRALTEVAGDCDGTG